MYWTGIAFSKKGRNMPNSSYADIYQTLKARIDGGQWQAGTTLPSENELCTEFGVSRNTVRRALELLIDEALIIRKPGIGSSVAARPDKRSGVPVIGLDLGTALERLPFYNRLLQTGTQEACARYGARLCLFNKEAMTEEAMESLSGFISVSTDPRQFPLLRNFVRSGKPVTVINRIPVQPELSWLSVDYEAEAAEMVGYALDMGLRRVAILGSCPGGEGFALRTVGWKKAFLERDLTPPAELMLESGKAFQESEMQQFLAEQRPEAIFVTAGEFMNFLLVAGMRLNSCFFDDVLVMCFDDFSELEAWRSIPIAFIQMPLREMAEAAVRHIVEYPGHPQPLHRIMKSRFVFNAGCLALNRKRGK